LAAASAAVHTPDCSQKLLGEASDPLKLFSFRPLPIHTPRRKVHPAITFRLEEERPRGRNGRDDPDTIGPFRGCFFLGKFLAHQKIRRRGLSPSIVAVDCNDRTGSPVAGPTSHATPM